MKPIDHVKIARHVKNSLLAYFGEGMMNFTDWLLDPAWGGEDFPKEEIDRTAGWGNTYQVVASGGPDGLVGDSFLFSINYNEVDEDGMPIEDKEYEINLTLRVVQFEIRNSSKPRDDSGSI